MKLPWPFPRTETKSLGNPADEEIAILTGAPSGAGTISAAQALSVPAVQSAVRLVAEAAASLDIRVERKVDGAWTVDSLHPVAVLLAGQPNDWTSTFELIRDLVATALCHDKGALAFVNRVGGEVREIVRYDTAHFQVDYSGDGRQEPSFRINNELQKPSDVIFIRSPFSKCPLSLAADAIGAAKAMEQHARNLFERGARPGGVIESPKPLGKETFSRMKAAWRAAHEGADSAGRTAFLFDGATFKQLALNSTDAQFLENRKFQILEICRAFRVPPSMIYELGRATWANGEQQGQEFLSYSLEPWLLSLEAAMRWALFLPEERGIYRIRFDRDDLTRADLGARATAISSLIAAKVMNPNEGRDWLDLPPYPGGEEFANPHINPSSSTREPQ
ncbi:phage portal protein [Gellertiella hungarica]|uniref:HK97 family phage portal protein n=1 Tax=Gellertiella hungarica TaxID=1572859 RepID=A0A7W6J4N3_9HYPH|nr:phage portal protein [Gellertiella hungarica]MBB4064741.1 HK97 family phage portal protein [Gellertiella hungarica]